MFYRLINQSQIGLFTFNINNFNVGFCRHYSLLTINLARLNHHQSSQTCLTYRKHQAQHLLLSNCQLLTNSNINSYRQYYRKQSNNKSYNLIVNIISLASLSWAIYAAYDDYDENNSNTLTQEIVDQIAPVELPKSEEDIRKLELYRVTLRGHFEHENEVFLSRRQNNVIPKNVKTFVHDADGYNVLTPFVLDDGRRVLVNRGWVSKHRKDASERPLGQIEGPTTLTAYVMIEENMNVISYLKTMFVFANTESNTFTKLNIDQLSKQLSTENVAVFVVDQDSSQKYGPIGGQIVFNMQDDFKYFRSFLGIAFALIVRLYRK